MNRKFKQHVFDIEYFYQCKYLLLFFINVVHPYNLKNYNFFKKNVNGNAYGHKIRDATFIQISVSLYCLHWTICVWLNKKNQLIRDILFGNRILLIVDQMMIHRCMLLIRKKLSIHNSLLFDKYFKKKDV